MRVLERDVAHSETAHRKERGRDGRIILYANQCSLPEVDDYGRRRVIARIWGITVVNSACLWEKAEVEGSTCEDSSAYCCLDCKKAVGVLSVGGIHMLRAMTLSVKTASICGKRMSNRIDDEAKHGR